MKEIATLIQFKKLLILVFSCLSISCFCQDEKNWYYKNDITVFDSLSTAIGFLEDPTPNHWQDIRFYNFDGSEYFYEKEQLQVKHDYEIFTPIKVLSETDQWYRVNFGDAKLYHKSDTILKFHTWEEHIVKSVAAVGFNPVANPIRKGPSDQNEKLYYYHDEFYHPVKIQDDWLLIRKYNKAYGWIKWKNGDQILIDIFYLL